MKTFLQIWRIGNRKFRLSNTDFKNVNLILVKHVSKKGASQQNQFFGQNLF
jgi:hypothetical protein